MRLLGLKNLQRNNIIPMKNLKSVWSHLFQRWLFQNYRCQWFYHVCLAWFTWWVWCTSDSGESRWGRQSPDRPGLGASGFQRIRLWYDFITSSAWWSTRKCLPWIEISKTTSRQLSDHCIPQRSMVHAFENHLLCSSHYPKSIAQERFLNWYCSNRSVICWILNAL